MKAKNTNRVFKHFRLPIPLVAKLAADAKKQHRTQTAILEMALSEFMAKKH